MSAAQATELRALTFGTLDGSLWAAVVDRGAPALVVGTAGDSPAAEGIADGLAWADTPSGAQDGDAGAWTLSGDGVALTVTPMAEPVPVPDPEPSDGKPQPTFQPPPEGPADQQLCRVTGTITIGGAQRAVDCVGTRLRADGKPVATAGSVRVTSAWFADDQAVALLALRPAKGEGQEHETLAATLFDAGAWVPVSEPRLSTTYDGDGAVRAAGLELWITDGENEYPRRVAAERERGGASASAPQVRLSVTPLRCHSRGLDGTGVYVLASFAGV